MKSKKQEVKSLMSDLNIDANIFSEEELRLFEHGGIPLTDSEADSDSVRGSVSIGDIENSTNPLNPSRYSTIPKMIRQPLQQQEPLDIKNRYNSVIAMLEKQNAYLNAEIKRMQVAGEAEKQRIMSGNRIEVDRLLTEIKQLKARMAYQDAQMPGIREALAQVRDMLSGLVPESVYLKLRDLNQGDLPLQEWILVQVWELVYPFKKETEFQKKEIMALREELKQMGERQQHLMVDMEHNQKMMGDREDDIKRHKVNYDNSRKSLELELQKAMEELGILREKGARFDELNRDYRRIEQEKFLLEEKMGYYDIERNKEGKSLASEIYRIQDELKRKNDLLVQDKEYLTKENIGLLEKFKRLEDKLDKTEKDYMEAKNHAQEYLFQLLNHKNESSNEYEKKIYKEIQELKDKQQHELEMAKQNLIDIYEKQIMFLKEAKEELAIKKDNLEAQLKEKQYAYDQLLLDYRTMQRRIDADLSELRIQLRLKSEELERVQNIYEDNLANLKATKHENEMLREKINVIKSEYYKCQVDAKEEMTTIKAQLEVAKEQLSNYEGIENEIDQAIMKASVNEYDNTNPLLNYMGQVPTTSKRRIQQALNLAQRLQAKQRESEQYQKLLRERDQEIEKLQEEVQVQRDVIDKMHQPYQPIIIIKSKSHSYLVAHIEERDREIVKYKQALKKSEQDYQNLKAEYEDLKHKYQLADQDLERLKLKRQNIQNIQNILLGIATGNQTDMRQNLRNAINDISEALNSKSYFDPQTQQKYQQQTPPQKDQPNVPAWYNKLKNKK